MAAKSPGIEVDRLVELKEIVAFLRSSDHECLSEIPPLSDYALCILWMSSARSRVDLRLRTCGENNRDVVSKVIATVEQVGSPVAA